MRLRPFISAGESPRPYSEIVLERDAGDADARRIDHMRDEIARLEGEATDAHDAGDAAGFKRKQCEAEALRSALDVEFARRRMR